jgi:S-adenosylmethionine synthetase
VEFFNSIKKELFNMKTIKTCESVNCGHSDKTCDIIADSFLDEALRQDPNAMMAVECAIKEDLLMIYGEATTTAQIDYTLIANEVLHNELGYQKPFRIIQQISQQSPDINQAVCKDEIRANDQGIVYGFATNETPEMMPLPLVIAHKLMHQYEEFRRTRQDFYSDAKSQVSVVYENDKPTGIKTVLVSASHNDCLAKESIRNIISDEVITPVLTQYAHLLTGDTDIIVNPSGKFTIWGSYSDSGCVGRKIAVDSYGGIGKMGGGCFSSKNATKLDRSGAYYARYVAKNIVSRDMADKCEVAVSYGIGIAEPLSVDIDCFGTEKVQFEKIQDFVAKNFNFKPANIIKELDLLKPIYKGTACYGHFGYGETWEQIKTIKGEGKK